MIKVARLNHRSTKQGLIHHVADIRTTVGLKKIYLKNEIIDIVSQALEFDPLIFRIVGSRVAIEKGLYYYELHWNTTSGREK
jgi:hypothetical protein